MGLANKFSKKQIDDNNTAEVYEPGAYPSADETMKRWCEDNEKLGYTGPTRSVELAKEHKARRRALKS